MSNTCNIHKNHEHEHGKDCGHTAIKHNDHVDYLHDGHLHHKHEGHYDEHTLDINETNPNICKPIDSCSNNGHIHGEGCGHEAIPHGDHTDYIVDGRLHHVHGNHCDDHGPVEIIEETKK